MKQIIYSLLMLALLVSGDIIGQGSTSSSMRGTVTDASGETLIGANVVARHVPSGTVFGTATDLNGHFNLPGMRVGGPYEVTVSYTGYSELKYEGVNLRLGEPYKMNVTMSENAEMLDAISVIATAGVSGQNAGSSTQVSTERIENLPTLNRNIGDYLKLSPQSSSTGSGGTSFAGTNNRFNAIYVDGAVNNDVFGLSSSGTNGGQTGISPFSIDIIDQLQIVLSPYDVTLGGFAGGGVNAVTKSGTNKFAGSAYYFTQNEKLAGKTNGILATRLGIEDDDRSKLDEFTKKTYGASIGGPIKKDKIFFFTNIEIQNDEIPIPFETATYTGVDGRASDADLDRLRNHLINNFNYDPGTYGNTADALEGLKLFGKLDFNLNEDHRLTIRHQYTKAEQFNRNGGTSTRLNFSNNGVFFPTTTNSSAIELNSRFGTKMSNNLILGYTKVVDDRDGFGEFPYVIIQDQNGGDIRLGTDEFSTGNNLEQSTFTLTNNLKMYKGDHTITLGTHNEFYNTYNLFIRQNYGTYRFSSIDAFINGDPATEYDRSFSLVDNKTGDGSAAAAEFKAMQLGFYVQDQWTVNNRFTLSAGLRVDVPIITTDPITDTYLNSTGLPAMQAHYDIANDVESGTAPDGQLMWSPRVGFEYDLSADSKTKLRGGVGIFTSRIPFVWPGGMYTNNGLTVGSMNERDIDGDVIFRPDINNQYQLEATGDPSGQVDLFVKDFKYPQVLRGNLGLDKKFANGLEWTIEGLYTKTLNNVVYTQINSDPTVDFNWTGGPDTRPVYGRDRIDGTYSRGVYVASNTSEGYTYNFTTSLAKNFNKLSAYIAYSFGDAQAVNEGTSSQNSSQWRGQINIDGRNNPILGRSDFAAGHRVISSLTYKLPWTKDDGVSTTFSLFFNGQGGNPFSYVIDGGDARNINNEDGSTSRNRGLAYVPQTLSDINIVEYNDGDGNPVSVADQWNRLDAFIEADNGLSDQRGGYADKNGSWSPFQGVFDFAIRQDLGKSLGGNLHRLQLSLDIFNVANLLNKDWGVNYFNPGDFNNYPLYQFEGYAADGTTPQFTFRRDKNGKDDFDIGGTSSRWRMRLGIRYIFN